jgi:hypothetical protein
MNDQGNGPKSGLLTTEFYSMLLANVVAILLSLGVLTPHQAQSVNDAAPQIGAIVLFVVTNASYILTRFGLKLPWQRALASAAIPPQEAPVSAPIPATITPIPGVTLPVTDAT